MRKVIDLDESLLEDARQKASEKGFTLEEWIEATLRRSLQGQQQLGSSLAKDFHLVTFGRGGEFTDFDVSKTSKLLEVEDLARYRGTSRN